MYYCPAYERTNPSSFLVWYILLSRTSEVTTPHLIAHSWLDVHSMQRQKTVIYVNANYSAYWFWQTADLLPFNFIVFIFIRSDESIPHKLKEECNNKGAAEYTTKKSFGNPTFWENHFTLCSSYNLIFWAFTKRIVSRPCNWSSEILLSHKLS